MINSRNLNDLHPRVRAMAERFFAKCDEEFNHVGIDVVQISTYRDFESQAELFAQGRTKPGPGVKPGKPLGNVVTKAKPGESFHNWKVAFDVMITRHGKPVWETKGEDKKLWMRVGEIGESVGLEWAGRWVGDLVEFGHFQFTDGLRLKDFQAGKTIKAATK